MPKMQSFKYDQPSARVTFGVGAVEYEGVLALLQNAYVGRTPGSAADAPVGSPQELL
jgi:hypothetical protein